MGLKVSVKRNNKIPEVKLDFDSLERKTVKIGYIKNSEQQKIAAVQEFGAEITVTPKMRGFLASQGLHLKATTTKIIIPERSFMRTGSKEAEGDIQRKAEELIDRVIDGGISVDTFFEALGLEMKGRIQKFARDLKNPANHPFTTEQKGSSNPLVDTGSMIQAMEVEVD